MKKLLAALAISATSFAATSAMSATIDFTTDNSQGGGYYTEDGLQFDDIRIVAGNCDSLSGPRCGAYNNNETSVLTKVGGGTFSLTSFWYELLGRGSGGGKNFIANTFYVASNLGGYLSFASNIVGNNDGGHVVDLSTLALFQNVTSLTFSTNGGGNVRVDDFGIVEPSPVPVPAAGLMLLAGIAGLASLRKRKAA